MTLAAGIAGAFAPLSREVAETRLSRSLHWLPTVMDVAANALPAERVLVGGAAETAVDVLLARSLAGALGLLAAGFAASATATGTLCMVAARSCDAVLAAATTLAATTVSGDGTCATAVLWRPLAQPACARWGRGACDRGQAHQQWGGGCQGAQSTNSTSLAPEIERAALSCP